MKFYLFVCEGLTDEPLEDLGGRTPLEAAKTPTMDVLAQKGRVKLVSFVPSNLEATPDVAALSILGYDPLKFYTGLAPLEAPAFAIDQDDRQVVFRADFVTVLDDALMDPSSSRISDREAGILMKDLSTKFSGEKFEFYRGQGYKNYLLVRDEKMLDDLDELACTSPSYCVDQKISKHLPKGRGSEVVIRLMKEVSAFLENHEINRVRIDLGENPANRLWLWGQGKKPKLSSFPKLHGLSGASFGQTDLVKGLSKMTGLTALKSTAKISPDTDFVLFYFGTGTEPSDGNLKSKIKKIEAFDAFIASVLKEHGKETALRIAVTGDMSESLTQKKNTRNPTIALISGQGIAAEKNTAFNEKACAHSAVLEKGFEFLQEFLKC